MPSLCPGLLPAPEQDGQDLLVFGEAARSMGTEFLHLWWGGTGFQAIVNRSRGTKPLASGFFATTALTHHFFVQEEDENKTAYINHQPLTRSELETRMARLMAGFLKEAAQTAARVQRVRDRTSVPPPPPAADSCAVCGGSNPPDSRFCGHCGHQMGPG